MSTQSNHTPGPWLRGDAVDGGKITFSHPKSALTPIADVYTGIGRNEAEANARLIASAPDMLEACKEAKYHAACARDILRAGGNPIPELDRITEAAKAAIAKATTA